MEVHAAFCSEFNRGGTSTYTVVGWLWPGSASAAPATAVPRHCYAVAACETGTDLLTGMLA